MDVPAKSALFPFVLTLSLDGRPVRTLRLESTAEAGRHRLEADLPAPSLETGVVEVVLRTDSYFTTLEDGRMKSYRVLGARVR